MTKTVKPNYSKLLAHALNEPGQISLAYRSMHNYSVLNRAIALSQMYDRGIEVSPLASYRAWQKKGFQVARGQKAISLYLPVIIKEKDEAGNETGEAKTIFMMRPNWFAMSQTDAWNNGKPEMPLLPGWDMERVLDVLDINYVEYHELNGNSMGYSEVEMNNIGINPLSPHPMKTLMHEIAHQLLHRDGEGKDYSTAIKEVEAESVAFIVTSTLDALDDAAESSSRAYIQSWGNKEGWKGSIPDKHAQRIFRTANQVIKAGEETQD